MQISLTNGILIVTIAVTFLHKWSYSSRIRSANFYSIDTYRYEHTVRCGKELYNIDSIRCANECLLDSTCTSVSHNKINNTCRKHSTDLSKQSVMLKSDRDWRILYRLDGQMPPKILVFNAPVVIRYNQNLTVSCIAIGNPVPVIDIYTMATAVNVMYTAKDEMMIFDYQPKNDGYYRCEAKNYLGSDKIDLTLQGQP